MPQTEDMLVRVDATVDGLKRGMALGDQEVAKFQRNVDRNLGSIDARFAKLGVGVQQLRGFIGPLSAVLGGLSFTSLVKGAFDSADSLVSMSDQLGVSIERLQGLRFAASQSGVDAGALEQAISKLNVKIGDAATGSKSAQEVFAKLGIEFKDGAGNARQAEQVLLDLSDRIAALHSPAERAAALGDLLGDRLGPRLVALLSQGRAGLEQWQETAVKAGQVISDSTARELDAAKDTIEQDRNAAIVLTAEGLRKVQEVVDAGEILRLETLKGALQEQQAVYNEEIANFRKVQDDLGNIYEEDNERMKSVLAEREANSRKLIEIETRLAELRGSRTGARPSGLSPLPSASAGGGDDDGGDGATTGHAAATRELKVAVDELLSSMQQELDLTRETGAARIELMNVYKAMAAAQRDYDAGLRDSPLLTGEELARVKELSAALYEANEAKKTATDTTDAAADATDRWSDAYGPLQSSASSTIRSIIDGTFDARSALAGLLSDLAQAASSELLSGAFGAGGGGSGGGLFSSLFSAGASIFGSLFGGPAGAAASGLGRLGGRFAHGGSARPHTPYLVGEQGIPEIFVPSTAGDVVPMAAKPKMDADTMATGGTTIVNINGVSTTINLQGGPGTPAQNADLVKQMHQKGAQAIQAAIDDRIRVNLGPRGALRPNTVS